MRYVLGYLIVLIVGLLCVVASIAFLLVTGTTDRFAVQAVCAGIIVGIAGGLWVKDRIVGARSRR